jgi:hypothetical protein
MYQSPGAGMRHFKKPKVKEIEIWYFMDLQ